MRKVIIFLLLLVIPIKADAYYCNYEKYNIVQKKASNVNLMVDYQIVNDEAIFIITVYNLQQHQRIVRDSNKKVYNYNGNDSVIIRLKEPGMHKFYVYSDENVCDESPLKTLYAELPSYNKYYNDPLCGGLESHKYCQKWSSIDITYDEFKKGISEYRDKVKFEEEVIEENYKSIYEYILEFYLDSWFIILPVIIAGCLIGIFILKKRENKFGL